MSEQDGKLVASYGLGTINDRCVWIYDYGGGRIKAVDLMSPTNYSEWITPQTLEGLQQRARRLR